MKVRKLFYIIFGEKNYLIDYQMEVEGFTGQIGKLLETSVSSKSFAISVLSHFDF